MIKNPLRGIKTAYRRGQAISQLGFVPSTVICPWAKMAGKKDRFSVYHRGDDYFCIVCERGFRMSDTEDFLPDPKVLEEVGSVLYPRQPGFEITLFGGIRPI